MSDQGFPHAPEFEALWTWTRRQPWSDKELEEAMADFLAVSGPTFDAQARRQHELRFVDWFHLDRKVVSLAATPLISWLAATGQRESPLTRNYVGAFRVTRAVPHSRVVLSSVRENRAFRVKDKALSVGLRRGQLAFGRLYPYGEDWVSSIPLLAVEEETATRLRAIDELAAIADGLTLERLLFKPQ